MPISPPHRTNAGEIPASEDWNSGLSVPLDDMSGHNGIIDLVNSIILGKTTSYLGLPDGALTGAGQLNYNETDDGLRFHNGTGSATIHSSEDLNIEVLRENDVVGLEENKIAPHPHSHALDDVDFQIVRLPNLPISDDVPSVTFFNIPPRPSMEVGGFFVVVVNTHQNIAASDVFTIRMESTLTTPGTAITSTQQIFNGLTIREGGRRLYSASVDLRGNGTHRTISGTISRTRGSGNQDIGSLDLYALLV